jgi:hypothetical protein
MISYVLTVVMLLVTPAPIAATATAEYNTLDACWQAASKIIDPVKNAYPDAQTFSTCAFKGQPYTHE